MKIEDNFLEQNIFDKLQNYILGKDFAWYFNSIIVYAEETSDRFQFTHHFYFDPFPKSDILDLLNPIFDIIKPISLWRIKANLQTRTSTIIKNEFHVDMNDIPEEKVKQWTTSIFYINTNNGYTEFEDGTKVESIANRFVTFPANMKHRGTSCTDEKTRVVINFNYFIK